MYIQHVDLDSNIIPMIFFQTGVDFDMPDYDGRTALHLAVCGGNLTVVKFLIDKAKCNVNPLDRWNSTPLDDA